MAVLRITLRTGLAIAMLAMLGACDQDNDSKASGAMEEAEAITGEVVDSTADALDSAGEMVEDAVDMAKETAEEMGNEIADEAEEQRKALARQAEEALEEGEGEIDSVLQGLND